MSKIAVSRGNICVSTLSNDNINVYEYTMEQPVVGRCHFGQKKHFSKSLVDADLSSVWFEVVNVASYASGLCICLLVLKFKNGLVNIYYCSDKDNKLVELPNFSLPSNTSVIDIKVAHGPTILILENFNISIVCPLYNFNNTLDIRTFALKQPNEIKILQFQCVENYLFFKGYSVLYLCILALRNSSESQIIVLATLCHSDGEKSEETISLPLQVFCPTSFKQSIVAVNVVIENKLWLKQNIEEKTGIKNLPWLNNRAIICTETELLTFVKGQLTHRCEIPFCDTTNIIIPKNSYLDFKFLSVFLESSANGICYVSYKKEIKNLQCTKTWKNAQCALPGDFRRNGSKQVLLIFDDSFECWQVGCSLLHLNMFSESLSEDSEIPDEHLVTTVTALNKRVTAGAAAIVDAHYKIAQKCAATFDIFNRIVHKSSEHDGAEIDDQSLQDNLLDIILSEDEKNQTCKKTHRKTDTFCLKIVNDWRVVHGKHWILGWTLANVAKSAVTNIHFTLTMAEESVEYKQKLLTPGIPSPEITCVDAGDMVTAIVAVQIPKFVMDSIKFFCVISWSIGKDSKNHVLFADQASLPCQQINCNVVLNLRDVFESSLLDLPAMNQLMCHRILREKVLLSIVCKTSDASSSFCSLLRESPPAHLEAIEHWGHQCFIFNKDSPLAGVNFTVDQIESNVTMEVFVKNMSEAMLLVQLLYSVCPTNTVIVPLNAVHDEKSDLCKSFLSALKSETDLLQALYHQPGAEPATEKEKVTLKKETFLALREKLTKNEYITDSIAKRVSNSRDCTIAPNTKIQ